MLFRSDASLELKCPIWSPDGKRLAYISGYDKLPVNENQVWSLWVADSDKPVFQTASVLRLLGWAGENEFIVARAENVVNTKAMPTKVILSKISTGGEQQLASLDATYLANLFLSPDGKNIAYVASQNGKENIYMMSASGGNIRQLTKNADPRKQFSTLNWAADSKALFYGKNEVDYGLTLITSKGDECMHSETAFSIKVLNKNSKDHIEVVERDFYADDFKTFLVLREVLDIFQRSMIEYYLAGETIEERNARSAEIQKGISQIPNEAWMISQRQCTEDGDCSGGQKCINGTCQDGLAERVQALDAYALSAASE